MIAQQRIDCGHLPSCFGFEAYNQSAGDFGIGVNSLRSDGSDKFVDKAAVKAIIPARQLFNLDSNPIKNSWYIECRHFLGMRPFQAHMA